MPRRWRPATAMHRKEARRSFRTWMLMQAASRNAKLAFGLFALLIAGVAVAILFQPPAWIVLLLGSALMAAIFVAARRDTDYEALDPTFRNRFPLGKQPEDR